MPFSETDGIQNYSTHMGITKRFVANVLMYLMPADITDEQRVELLQQAGIPAEALDDPGFLITADQERAALAALVQRYDSPYSPPVFGYYIGEASPLSSFGIVGLAAQAAPNLFDAIRTTTQFPELIWGTTRTAIYIDEGQTILSFQFERSAEQVIEPGVLDLLEQRVLASNLFIFRRYMDDLGMAECEPSLMTLPMAQPDDWHLIADQVGAAVRFNANEATLVYDMDLRDAPTRHGQPILYKLYLDQAETLANMLREDLPIKERVARFLWTLTPPPSREEVAKKLGISVRSLSRSLQGEGTSFKELFLDIQLQRAKILLQDTEMNAATIAFRLGFNDPASFTRSFKAQTGRTPTEWRGKAL